MKKNRLTLMISILSILIFSGCSTVPLEPKEVSQSAKLFNQPPEGDAGIYVYRNSFGGQALKRMFGLIINALVKQLTMFSFTKL